jgi:hypothetical protein
MAMSGRHGLGLIVFGSLACAACGGVAERPGHDFAVRVLDEAPIRSVGQIYAPVRFAVEGCSAFDLALDDEAGTSRPLSFSAQPDGTFVASVPVAWMRSSLHCGSSFMPGDNDIDPGTIVVTCQDAGRTAKASFTLDAQIGRSWTSDSGHIRALFPGDQPGQPWWIATSDYGGEVWTFSSLALRAQWAPVLNPAAYRNPLVRPRVARRGDRAFASLGCETFPVCPEISIGPGESLPGERLADFAPSDETFSGPRGIARVSANVIDMAFVDDETLVVVTDTSVGRGPPQYLPDGTRADDDAARWGETIVWRVQPAPEDALGIVEDSATVIARFSRETVVSRLSRTASGALAFVTIANPGTFSDVRVNLRVTDGATVDTRYTAPGPSGCSYLHGLCFDWLREPTFVNSGVYLSPDASSLILTYDADAQYAFWVSTGSLDPDLQRFGHWWSDSATRLVYNQFSTGGSAWLPDAVALWAGGDLMSAVPSSLTGVIHVYEAAPPHAFRYRYAVERLPGATADPVLVGAVAVGDRLVLSTTTGVRVLDAAGNLVGGADPLPCGVTLTAPAEQVGPTTVAFGVGKTAILFEVGP